MNPPHLIRENSFKFNNSGSSSYNFAEIWPFLVNGDGSDGVLLQSFQQSGEKRGQFVGLGFAENCNRDVSVDESTVTEQSTGELQQSGRGGGGRKRQEGSEDESSKLLSTSSDYNVQTDSEYKRLKVMESREKNGYSKLKQDERSIQPADPLKQDYIHVKARRGQATDSHSLAERARREKISERMKILQDLVPGCNKVIGKALVLDEIINYIQSLQRQVEFLSMKLEAVNSRIYASNERFPSKDFAMQTFDTASMTFGSQATMTYPRSPQEWLQMQVGGGFDRAT